MSDVVNIYLGGPDVFLPNAIEIGEKKKALCEQYGFVGLYPLDNEIKSNNPKELSRLIFLSNVELMRKSSYMIANLTPFRGPSADAGTIWEVGHMIGLGKSVIGYSNFKTNLYEYTQEVCETQNIDNNIVDEFGMTIENFGNSDNLMISESMFQMFYGQNISKEQRFTDLNAFEKCLSYLHMYKADNFVFGV